MIIRAPNHLGDLVMALPALSAGRPDAVVVTRWLAPLVELAGFEAIPFDGGARGFARTVLRLRRARYAHGVLLTPSFSSALMFRLGGVRARRGTDTDNRALLLTARVDRTLLARNHRASAYWLLVNGDPAGERPVPRLAIPNALRAEFRARLGSTAPLVGICPGSNAASRTWPAERFAVVARELAKLATVVVFGAASEQNRTRTVAGDVAIDMGGRTDLRLLAAGLAECRVVISNDSGPLHLAAAVGARTISVWGAGDPSRTGPPDGHVIVRDQALPCLECVKNRCPRSGPGYILPDAYNECLHLIGVEDVMNAARIMVSS
ncbi:MAG TPA: glycosyltransferase family 9 protein [Longimicrobiales bacterium]